jgi:hypothetical protein
MRSQLGGSEPPRESKKGEEKKLLGDDSVRHFGPGSTGSIPSFFSLEELPGSSWIFTPVATHER